MREQKFRKLKVWNKAMSLVESVYRMTCAFPAKETYGLTNQLRRAAISISLNIAEGSGAGSDNEFCRFLNISQRSSYEVMCGLEIANRLGYCADKEKNDVLRECDEISAMLFGLKTKLKQPKFRRLTTES